MRRDRAFDPRRGLRGDDVAERALCAGAPKSAVPQRLKLSCTRPSSGCRKITQGSNIDLGMTLTS